MFDDAELQYAFTHLRAAVLSRVGDVALYGFRKLVPHHARYATMLAKLVIVYPCHRCQTIVKLGRLPYMKHRGLCSGCGTEFLC